jgi:uncharacterized protein (TIGR03437 family)
LGSLAVVIYASASGPPPRRTGAPGDQLCTACHAGTENPAGGKVEVSFPAGQTYLPGVLQQWTVKITDAEARRFGFELTTRPFSNETNGQAGDLNPQDANTRVRCEDGSFKGTAGCAAAAPLQFIQQALAGTGGSSFTFDWMPPDRDQGNVRVWVAGNGANGDGRATGDRIYTANYTLTPSTAPQERPSIATENGVLNGASFKPGIAAGSWISIFGRGLAPGTRIWRGYELVDSRLPAKLDGVSVTINNKPASVYYVSPTQLNVQVPSDEALGPVAVQVTTLGGASNTVTAQMQAFSPALFAFDPENRKYAAAQHTDYSYLAKPGLFAGAATRGASPGETILLYGTGFGPTSPAVPAGQVVAAPTRLANPVTVRIGGSVADVSFAGLSAAGLYQFNVKVPETLADGDAAVVVEVGGVRSPDGVFITVQR